MPSISPDHDCFSRRNVARNTIYSVVGQVLPLPVAIISIPYIISGLGLERFGVLAIAWMIVGYFGLFDIGIGRSTTKFTAELFAEKDNHGIRQVMKASVVILLSMGIISGLLLALSSKWIVESMLNIPPELTSETKASLLVLSLSLPFVLLIAGARGVLEALQEFRTINAIKVPSGIATYIVPLLVLPFSKSLYPIICGLVLSKIISFVFYAFAAFRKAPKGGSPKHGDRVGYYGRLLKFGGWISVSHLVGPIITYLDRLVIGSVMTMVAVSYYATPTDIISRLYLFPSGIMIVVFPVFSVFSVVDKQKLSRLFERTVKYILFLMTPISFVAIVFSYELLAFWMNPDFAANSAVVFKILATSILFSSISRVPMNATQAIGRPDISGKFYLVELPLVAVALYFLTPIYGITGAALVVPARIIIEAIFMFYHAHKMIIQRVSECKMSIAYVFTWIFLVCAIGWILAEIDYLMWRVIGTLVIVLGGGAVVYRYILEDFEKQWVRTFSRAPLKHVSQLR